jgi:acetoin utilization deacetylase AcuC-like enzyme
MDRMSVFFDERVLEYRIPAGMFDALPSTLLAHQMPQPENSERIDNTRSVLQRGPLRTRLDWHGTHAATDEEVLQFHTAAYLDELKFTDREGGYLSASTHLAAGELDIVRLGAGAAVDAARCVLGGDATIAYALGRPPSHHAQPAVADGYCFLNGVALAALEALNAGCTRVAVIDWDVHHGNGTQEGFYGRDDVLTVSMHMDHGAWGPSHVQTGGIEETGRGAGEGYNINLPLPFGSGDRAYEETFRQCVVPAVTRFNPDIIVLANGQDANQFDPNGRQAVSMAGFFGLATQARSLALDVCDGRIIMTQEGGYNPTYAPMCAYAVAAGLLGMPMELDDPISFYPDNGARADADVAAMLKAHSLL